MKLSIENLTRFFVITAIALSSCTVMVYAQSDFYVSSKSCIQDMGSTQQGGGNQQQGGGNQQGGGMMPTGGCDAPTTFFDTDTSATAWIWNFGDGSAPAVTRKVNYQYVTPGNYVTILTRTIDGIQQQPVSRNVLVGDYPTEPKFNGQINTDTTVCNGSSVKLNPYKLPAIPPSNVKYLWYPGGETTSSIDVDSSGCYSVEVMDKLTGCSRTAVINVKFCLQPGGGGGGSESWYFGNGATLDFQLQGTLVSDRDSLATDGGVFANDSTLTDASFSPRESEKDNEVNTVGASAMVYGPDGALKFYTDGTRIYTGDDVALTDLTGDTTSLNLDPTSQGLVIIPKSSCNECPHHQYYVFSVDKDTKLLSYSVVDLRYNDQQGAITETNVPVMFPVTERLIATPNADSTGFIIISHEANSDKYNLITVDSTGVLENIQAIGLVQDQPDSKTGYQTISPNGRFLAVGIVKDGINYVEIYEIDRDNLSLTLENTIQLEAAPPKIYGLAFGNNSDMLFVTLQGDGVTVPSKLYQLPLILADNAAIAAGKTLIDESTTEIFGALQLGPVNGNAAKFIYMAIDGSTELPYIQDPDSRGGPAVVGYTRLSSANEGIKIPGTSRLGFPNVVFANQSQDGDGIQATYSGNCFDKPTVLEIQEVCSPMRNEIEWIFPDGTTDKEAKTSHTFKKVGWNKIRVKITTYAPTAASKAVSQLGNIPVVSKIINRALESKCKDTTIVDSIYIKPSPVFAIADSAFICTKDRPPTFITINPRPKGGDTFEYNWLTGLGTRISGTDTATDSLEIMANGNYRLEIENNFSCDAAKDFKIIDKCEPRIYAPTAFTPNKDNINDDFVVRTAHITDYKLSIFDRWGELIYESDDPDAKRWNGSIKGKTQSPLVYPWRITYRSLDFPERGELEERGAIMVVK
jgi:gliding motility-associated-like protein